MRTSKPRFTESWEGVRRTAESLDTPSNSEDRGSDEQPSVDHAILRYGPFPAESRLLFTSSIEVRDGSDWQRSQSEEDEGWVEVAVERGDKELDDSAGNCERGQMKPESELYGRQK